MNNLASISNWVENEQSYDSFLWACPFCNRDTTIRDIDREVSVNDAPHVTNQRENVAALTLFVRCPNSQCKRFVLYVLLYATRRNNQAGSQTFYEQIAKWQLVPASEAKQFPSYVPEPILKDYEEASLIVGLSPRASATLARRCLQGMIRDFHGIRKRTLSEEIEAINDKVDSLAWEAIDAVRKVGNIGAHMEKDINVIVDVDPDEASMLLSLIESLIEEWYIAQHERESRMRGIVKLGESKEQARKGKT